jgi:hypothetical protein
MRQGRKGYKSALDGVTFVTITGRLLVGLLFAGRAHHEWYGHRLPADLERFHVLAVNPFDRTQFFLGPGGRKRFPQTGRLDGHPVSHYLTPPQVCAVTKYQMDTFNCRPEWSGMARLNRPF